MYSRYIYLTVTLLILAGITHQVEKEHEHHKEHGKEHHDKEHHKDHKTDPNDDPDYKTYDMYVYSIQWDNTYCLGKPDCQKKIQHQNIFSIHGLWPNFISEKRISDCNTGQAITVDPQGETREIMDSYWSSLKGTNEGFWEHEYNKHGYCVTERYNFPNEQKFFDDGVGIYQKWQMNQLMTHTLGDIQMRDNDEVEFTFDELTEQIHNARTDLFFTINCVSHEKKQYISEIHFYFDLEFSPLDHQQHSSCDKDKSIYVTFEN